MTIKFSFINPADNSYNIFENDYVTIKQVTSDPATWMDYLLLPNLTVVSYKKIDGYQMAVYSDTTGDATAVFNTYDVVETTDKTAISLQGYAGISKFNATGIGCKVIISFDKRLTWYAFNTTTLAWKQVSPENIYLEGTTLAQMNTISAADIAKIYKRTQLDFMVAIADKDSFGGLGINLLPNTAPVISNVVVSKDSVHNENVSLKFDLCDLDGDELSYKVYINDSTEHFYSEAFSKTVMTGSVTPTLVIPYTSLLIGSNAIKIIATDSKNASNTKIVYVTRTNYAPTLYGMLYNNKYTAVIGDQDLDKVKYRVLLNGNILKNWSEFLSVPLSIELEVDKSKIIYNQQNTLKIEFMDDVSDETLYVEEHFVGAYYGLLFTDPVGKCFSDSIGGIIKHLDFGPIVSSRETPDKEIHVINKSNYALGGVIINAEATDIDFLLSTTNNPFTPQKQISINNLKIGDKIVLYVRAKTTTASIGKKIIKIKAEGNKN